MQQSAVMFVLIHKYEVKIQHFFMHNHIPVVVGFIAVMLVTGTHLAWSYVVLILLYRINSSEYCQEKTIFIEAASTSTSKKLSLRFCCLSND